MQVRLRDFYAVELALQHMVRIITSIPCPFTLAKQTKLACFEKFCVLPDF
jgi:hypothetical protein